MSDQPDRKPRILWVDDETTLLNAIVWTLRKEFEVTTCERAADALDLLASDEDFAVVAADMHMPEMDGVTFLHAVRDRHPEIVRIMCTADADQAIAVEAINRGEIFRLINKPSSPERVRAVLRDSVEQHRLIHSERELLASTLIGSVAVLGEVLKMTHPQLHEKSARVRQLAADMCRKLAVEDAWKVELAANVSQIGLIPVSRATLAKIEEGRPLSPEEQSGIDNHPKVARNLLLRIPRLGEIAEIVGAQAKSSRTDSSSELTLHGEILRIALDFEEISARDVDFDEIMTHIYARRGRYSTNVIHALVACRGAEHEPDMRLVLISDLRPGMVIADDLVAQSGAVVIKGGQELTDSNIVSIGSFTYSLLTARVRTPRVA